MALQQDERRARVAELRGLRVLGVDRALWLGTPYFSKWKESVLRDTRWDVDRTLVGRPFLTFVQTLVDMKNSMHVVPGQFVARGHDYRGDLAAFVNEAYGFGASPDKLRRVEEALRRYEMRFAEYVEQARRSQATEASG